MHRSIQVAVQSGKTLLLLEALKKLPTVIGLSVIYDASVKPQGDVLQINVLNRGADDVLRIIQAHTLDEQFSIATSEVSSLNTPQHQKLIDKDIDEAIWEEMETGLRHNGHITSNFLTLMASGGAIASLAFVQPMPNQVIAFIAASIIAPGLEPLAKIPLGISLQSKDVFIAGLRATAIGYLALMLAAALTFQILVLAGASSPHEFVSGKYLQSLTQLQLGNFLISLLAAIASITMYLAYRRNVIAGPLVALVLIPTTTASGICISLSQWTLAFDILARLGTDLLIVILTGLVLIVLKQKLVHKRKSLR